MEKEIESLIDSIAEKFQEKETKKLELEKLKKAAGKTADYKSSCSTCSALLDELKENLHHLIKQHSLPKSDMAAHKKVRTKLLEHLRTEHGIIEKGYYTSLYMSLGIAIGLPFGLLLFDNVALGLPIGLSIGLAIGAGADHEKEKKGKVL